MVKVLLLFVAAVFAAALQADVYRWVDDTGRVQYTDRPHEGSEALATRGRERANPPSPSPVPSGTEVPGPALGPYEAFEIVSPEQNQTLRPEGADIPVSLLLNPPLQEGHRLQLNLDGQSIDVDPSLGAQLSMSGVTLGTHTVSARILDDDGEIIAESTVLTFHLRKPLPPDSLP